MESFKKIMGTAIITVCAVLFAMAVIGNMFLGSVNETTITAISADTAEAVADLKADTYPADTEQSADREMANRIAALRMERDRSWQYLQNIMTDLYPADEKVWQSYAVRQYREQRLELLLQAKGITHCLVMLEEKNANILISEQALKEDYEKIFDLVLRNSEYSAEQIVLIPVKPMDT